MKQLSAGKNISQLLPGYLLLLNCHLVRYMWFLSAREISLAHGGCICVVYSFHHTPELCLFLKWWQTNELGTTPPPYWAWILRTSRCQIEDKTDHQSRLLWAPLWGDHCFQSHLPRLSRAGPDRWGMSVQKPWERPKSHSSMI